MQITFDTDKDSALAAQALVDLLTAIYVPSEPAFTPPQSEPEERLTLGAEANFGPNPHVGADDGEKADTPADAAKGAAEAVFAPPQNAPRDAAGVAWDERVHTSNQATKQDGRWKRKPGLDDEFYESVMAELTAQAVEPEAANEEAVNSASTAAAAFAPPPVGADDGAPAPSFLSNMQMITQIMRDGGNKATIDNVLKEAGLFDGVDTSDPNFSSMALLVAASPAKQAEVAALLEAI